MTMFTEGDTVIIAKGNDALPPGTIGRVTAIQCVKGSQLVPGSDSETKPVQLVTVEIDGNRYLFGPVDNPISKVDASCTTADRGQLLRDLATAKRTADQSEIKYFEAMLQAEALEATVTDSLTRVRALTSQITRLATMNEIARKAEEIGLSARLRKAQYALNYRRQLREARAELAQAKDELVKSSEAYASKELEVQEMRAAQRLASDITVSVEKAAGVTEGMVGRMELKIKSLEADLQRALQDKESIAQTAKRPQVAAETLLRQFGYTGDLLDMIKAQQHDREVAQKAFSCTVAADSEPGKILVHPAVIDAETKAVS